MYEGPTWSLTKNFDHIEKVRDCLCIFENVILFLSGRPETDAAIEDLNVNVAGMLFK